MHFFELECVKNTNTSTYEEEHGYKEVDIKEHWYSLPSSSFLVMNFQLSIKGEVIYIYIFTYIFF